MEEFTNSELREWILAKAHQLDMSEDHEFDETDKRKLDAVVRLIENEKALN